MKKRLVVFVLAASVASVAACGDSSFGSANGADGGDDDGSNSVTGGRADGGSSDAASDDAKMMGDVACSPEQADPAVGLFVDLNSVAPSGSCGSAASPCAAIQTAIDALATTGKTTVYVAVGTYAQSLALKPGLTIKGGWKNTGGKYARACSSNPASGVVIQATGNITVKATDLAGTATLETLTIASKAGPAASGESLYGIFATGASTTLALSNVVINVAGGGNGATGTTGTTAASGGICFPASTGAPGVAATSAAPAATASTYAAAGYTPGAGNSGPSGNPGANGALTSDGTTCQSGGTGCDSAPCVITGGPTVCQPAGGIGCGGSAGGGGGGGSGAGSSIGVYSWGAHVTADTTSITSGAGGTGGAGGPGGPIGMGSVGPRISATVVTSCGPLNSTCPVTSHQLAGTFGSAGGNGSAGLAGGGGPGGDSYAVYNGLGATFTGTTTPLAAGVASGVSAGNPPGPGGTSAQSN